MEKAQGGDHGWVISGEGHPESPQCPALITPDIF